jgi:hypothetical protein
MAKSLQRQVGGSHYVECRIQPVEFIQANALGFCEGNIVKYVSRHHLKNGKVDLEKALHYIQILIELEYPDGEA